MQQASVLVEKAGDLFKFLIKAVSSSTQFLAVSREEREVWVSMGDGRVVEGVGRERKGGEWNVNGYYDIKLYSELDSHELSFSEDGVRTCGAKPLSKTSHKVT